MNTICPVCEAELVSMAGNQLYPGDKNYGVTLWCPSGACPAQEVSGHGDTVKEAFEVITHRFKGVS